MTKPLSQIKVTFVIKTPDGEPIPAHKWDFRCENGPMHNVFLSALSIGELVSFKVQDLVQPLTLDNLGSSDPDRAPNTPIFSHAEPWTPITKRTP